MDNREKKKILLGHFQEASSVLSEFINDPFYADRVSEASQVMIDSINSGGKIISAGNGGSMCDAMHFAEELTGRWRKNRRAIPAISISDPSHISCVANDFGYDSIFSRYIEGVGKKEDVFLGISTSGNSPNVIKAIQAAGEIGMKCIILTGKTGGKISEMEFDGVVVNTPYSEFADRVQEMHIKIIHTFIDLVEKNCL